jgi:hypothetical protein
VRGHVAPAVDANPPILAHHGRAVSADRAVGQVGERYRRAKRLPGWAVNVLDGRSGFESVLHVTRCAEPAGDSWRSRQGSSLAATPGVLGDRCASRRRWVGSSQWQLRCGARCIARRERGMRSDLLRSCGGCSVIFSRLQCLFFLWLDRGPVFKKTLFRFQGFDPSVPHVPQGHPKILR